MMLGLSLGLQVAQAASGGIDPYSLSPAQGFDAQQPARVLNAGGTPATNGQNVATFQSRVGSFHATQATDANRPSYNTSGLNGFPAISCAGANSMGHTYARGAGQALTIFAVVNITSGSGFRGIYATNGDGDTNETMMLASTSSPQWGTFGGSIRSANSTIVGAGPKILCMRRTGAGGDFYINGVADGTFAASSGQFGYLFGIPGQQMTGFAGEIIVFDSALAVGTIAGITTFLGSKWGIAV